MRRHSVPGLLACLCVAVEGGCAAICWGLMRRDFEE